MLQLESVKEKGFVMLSPELLQPTFYREFLNNLENKPFRKLLIVSTQPSLHSSEDKMIEIIEKFPTKTIISTNKLMMQNKGIFNSKSSIAKIIQEEGNHSRFKKKLSIILIF